jgi:hypothetical protein
VTTKMLAMALLLPGGHLGGLGGGAGGAGGSGDADSVDCAGRPSLGPRDR